MTTTPLDLSPGVGVAATAGNRVWRQAALELRMNLRNGEQLLLTLVIPLLLLGVGSAAHLGASRRTSSVDFLTPGVLALAVMSTAFTGLAIATGFERRSRVLVRLATTPLGRPALLAGKALGALGVLALQVLGISVLALVLGWHPHGRGVAGALLVGVVGALAFSALGLLMAGTLRAEATLAAANGAYLVLLLLSGMVIPGASLPHALTSAARVLPSAALAHGLRQALSGVAALDGADLCILLGWAVLGAVAAARWFRWE